MAEFLVDKLLNALTDGVMTKLREEFKLVTGVKDEVDNLASKLRIIRGMLQDVQIRKLKEEPVGIWLERLEDIAYDVDDVLDEWNTEVQKLKIMVEEDQDSLSQEPQPKSNKVCSSLLSIGSGYKQVSVRRDIADKIKELNGRMDMVFQEANEFKFVWTNLSSTSQEHERLSTTSLVDESEVYARDSAKDAIVSMLLPSGDGIHIVSVVGVGGIGKTTLAQLVYNDNRVKDHFEVKQWICVSDPFDQKRIARAILAESSPDMFELETLLQRVKASIFGKKFLLVLDDVWAEDYNKWKPIWNSLKDGAPGSRILVTTRKEMVAKILRTTYLHQLDQLSDSDCWKIVSRIAFLGRSENECKKFAAIGKQISKKCAGLPLAANFLGCLLQSKDTVAEWKSVLESEMWELEEATTDLFPHIYLSYNELTPEVKRCFLYCAVFPKDSWIIVKDLIRQWMAQGYLKGSSSTRRRVGDLESRGYEYFINLAKRSFYQNFDRDKDGKIVACKMHDIVHDFAQHLTNGECLIIENSEDVKVLSQKKVRHLTWSYDGGVEVNSMVNNVGKLRSFYCKRNSTVDLEIFNCLTCVRALRLCQASLEEVPKAIGKLRHLRYLDLSNNFFKELPEEICELYNLETLNVTCCHKLTQFPERIGNLRNLRCLENEGTSSFKQFPRALEKLTSLQTLPKLKVGNGYSKLEYLRNLNQLQLLEIEFDEVDDIDFESAKLRDKIHMETLTLRFENSSNNGVCIRGDQAPTPPNMITLELYTYPNTQLPSWIMSLRNLVRLCIDGGNVTSLPALGKLSSLETLEVWDLKGMEFLRREVLGITEFNTGSNVIAFPKLKVLEFELLSNLRIWEDLREEDENNVACDLNIMPCLEELILDSCYKLEILPHGILRRAKSLNKLIIEDCPGLTKRYKAPANWIHISHIPMVKIDGQIMKLSNSQP